MKPFPRDLEEVQIQPSKEIAVTQLESAKKLLSATLEQMQQANHSVLFAFGVIVNAIEHAIDVVNKHYEPATPTPEELEKVNRNWEKIQQWAKGGAMTESNGCCDPDPTCKWCCGTGAIHTGRQASWESWIETPCPCTQSNIGQMNSRRERLEGELNRLREGIRSWSYCTSQGMLSVCPEKVEELGDFLISCGIAPYYTKKQAETLKQ